MTDLAIMISSLVVHDIVKLLSRHPLALQQKPDQAWVERAEYDRLTTLAKAAQLPDYPGPNAKGNYPAREYLRISIARDIIKDRVAAGLSQKDLARLAGVRVETLCRIETGKHTPSGLTVEKIDRALKRPFRKAKGKAAESIETSCVFIFIGTNHRVTESTEESSFSSVLSVTLWLAFTLRRNERRPLFWFLDTPLPNTIAA